MEVDIDIVANDMASATIQNITDSLMGMGSAAQSSASAVTGATSSMTDSLMGVGTAAESSTSAVTGATSSMTRSLLDSRAAAQDAGASVTDTFQSAAHVGATAMIALDRYQISTDAVANAQVRQELATTRLNDAIRLHGAGSAQAKRAQDELEISTRGLEIAQERMTVRMIYGTAVIIPSMISNLRALGETLDLTTLKEDLLTEGITMNTAAQLANIAVMTLGIGLPLAFLALTAAQGMGPSSTNINHYGDINVQGGVGNAMGPSSYAQVARP